MSVSVPSVIRVLKTSKATKIKLPSYPGDMGFNVACTEQVDLLPGVVTRVNIGMQIALPEGMVCTQLARSGAVAEGLFVLPTIIDEGYRGPMYLFVINFGQEHRVVFPGESIAQLVLLINTAPGITIEYVDELPPSARGVNGFYSTGKAVIYGGEGS